jgi:hypothetical protein
MIFPSNERCTQLMRHCFLLSPAPPKYPLDKGPVYPDVPPSLQPWMLLDHADYIVDPDIQDPEWQQLRRFFSGPGQEVQPDLVSSWNPADLARLA